MFCIRILFRILTVSKVRISPTIPSYLLPQLHQPRSIFLLGDDSEDSEMVAIARQTQKFVALFVRYLSRVNPRVKTCCRDEHDVLFDGVDHLSSSSIRLSVVYTPLHPIYAYLDVLKSQ